MPAVVSGVDRVSTELMPNVLREGIRMDPKPAPCTMVIFGASGDLTYRKLAPALYSLAQSDRLAEGFAVVGFSRSELSDGEFRNRLRTGIDKFGRTGKTEDAIWDWFGQSLYYVEGNYGGEDGSFERLKQRLEEIRQERGNGGNLLFYLATPPLAYIPIIRALGKAGLVTPYDEQENGWTRIVIEKPFGMDLASALELNQEVLAVFDERQVYRIDHYLGKETVQNILMLRFANVIFEPLWNHKYIDHVQITAAEPIGVEDRGGYYDRSGAMRDMIQNHLLQVMTLVAMEPPVAFDADAVRDEKAKVLRALRRLEGEAIARQVIRAQYGPGSNGGEPVPGYQNEHGVDPESRTETYVALQLFVDNWRWSDVPFFLRSGKRLARHVTEVAITFKRVPHALFQTSAENIESNVLVLRIQPNEGISLRFEAKFPGLGIQLRPVKMDFRYGESFGVESPSAYETLLLDVLRGDGTLFTRGDEVLQAWRLLDPVLKEWARVNHSVRLPQYAAGSWGPAEADQWIEATGRRWRRP